MTSTPVIEKFDRIAGNYREHDYAAPARYFERKADLVFRLEPRLWAGARVLDLGCGDGALATALVSRGVEYLGVDISQGMIEAARRREPRLSFVCTPMEDFEPDHAIDATVCMRSFYYPDDRRAFFRRVRSYTEAKFVFDFDPRVHDSNELRDDLAAAGFERVCIRRLLLPQRRRIAVPLQTLLFGLEPTPLSAALTRAGFPARMLLTAS